jgi:hypothetical protein
MSNLLIRDIPVFTDLPIEQQKIIVGGVSTDIGTNSIAVVPIINDFLGNLNFNPGDLQNYLNTLGLNIILPIT